MRKFVGTARAIALMIGPSNSFAQSIDPVLQDLCCDGYRDACYICNLAPHWAVLAFGVVASVGILVNNSACDTIEYTGHLH